MKSKITGGNGLPSPICQAVTWLIVMLQVGAALPSLAVAARRDESAISSTTNQP